MVDYRPAYMQRHCPARIPVLEVTIRARLRLSQRVRAYAIKTVHDFLKAKCGRRLECSVRLDIVRRPEKREEYG